MSFAAHIEINVSFAAQISKEKLLKTAIACLCFTHAGFSLEIHSCSSTHVPLWHFIDRT